MVIGLHACRSFPLTDGSGFWKSLVIFCPDMNSSVHIDNKKKYILILSKDPTDGLEDAKVTTEKEYSISFFRSTVKILFKVSL